MLFCIFDGTLELFLLSVTICVIKGFHYRSIEVSLGIIWSVWCCRMNQWRVVAMPLVVELKVGRVAVCVVTTANAYVVLVFKLGKAALIVCHLDEGAV